VINIDQFRAGNFRAFSEVELDFSRVRDGSLTVIRAEVESGKTTMLTAITWVLFGDEIIPKGSSGRAFRLSPIDWDAESNGASITVTAEIKLTVSGSDATTLPTDEAELLIRRSVIETINSDETVTRRKSNLKIHHITDSGYSEISSPETLLRSLFPPYLRDVFFTDGDRALNFIDGSIARRDRRSRVESSIRSLLGLDLLEVTESHLRQVGSSMNASHQQFDSQQEVALVSSEISIREGDLSKQESTFEAASSSLTEAQSKLASATRALDDALMLGNKEKLVHRRDSLTKTLRRTENEIQELAIEISKLTESREISITLLEKLLEKSDAKIGELYRKGSIPRNFLPILEERLAEGVCICGIALHDGSKEQEHLKKVIEEERKQGESAVIDRLTSLQHLGRSRGKSSELSSSWIAQLDSFEKQVGHRQTILIESGKELKQIQHEIDQIQDDKVPTLRTVVSTWRERFQEAQRTATSAEVKIELLKQEITGLKESKRKLLAKNADGRKALANLTVTQDLSNLVADAVGSIRDEKVKNVAKSMNEFFLQMIRSDPDSGIIRNSTISPKFDIEVFGPQNRHLEPDTDLNGASRRALTYSFILALTQESELEAPAFIDTPLGMTSGVVRRNIVEITAKTGRDTVLFLTRSEIVGVEDLLDKYASKFMTFTNKSHDDVLNRDISHGILRACLCSHRQYCEICERTGDDANSDLRLRVIEA
jgi:DNA sulfur modification protein DndD